MKNTKKLILLLLIIVLGVSGCMGKNNKKSTKDEMMEYMKNKYGEEFEFVNIDTQVWTAKYTEMILHSKSYKDARIVVHRDYKSGEITDNYVAFLLKKDMETTISKIASEIYGKNVVINIPTENTLPLDFNKKTTVDEYAKNIRSELDVNIFLEGSTSNKEKDVEKLRNILANKKYPISFTIIYLKTGVIEAINSTNYSNYTKQNSEHVLLRGDFVLNNSFEFNLNKWGDLK